MKLIQQNEPTDLLLCDDCIAETGEMSECISVIVVTKSGKLYGVHCGGGISSEWVDRIVDSMERTGEKTDSVIAVFGHCYQNPNELQFLDSKFDKIKDIAGRLGTNAFVLASSANATIKLTNGQIEPFENLKIWTSNGWA